MGAFVWIVPQILPLICQKLHIVTPNILFVYIQVVETFARRYRKFLALPAPGLTMGDLPVT